MFVLTNENFHIYVVTFMGLLIICFAVQMYIKNCLEIELTNLKKKVKKIQTMQEIMYKQKQLELRKQHEEQDEDRGDVDYMEDNDSYMDPITA